VDLRTVLSFSRYHLKKRPCRGFPRRRPYLKHFLASSMHSDRRTARPMLVERWATGNSGAVTLVGLYCSVSGQPPRDSGFRRATDTFELLSG